MANRFGDILKNVQNHAVAVAAIMVILMLLIPVPGILLDLLMIGNIAMAVIILVNVIYTPKSSDFSSFPQVVLFATLYGLSLNVCSTRLIITKASSYTYANFPGNMLKAFSSIVTGDTLANPTQKGLAVGMVIFIILIIIQTVVITKGATRVSEVSARFALDAMNTKMFAVDSELNSGYITDDQAREKKASIQRDIDFYSAMDGSSKFVSGNVKASIFITVIDLIVGIVVGMVIKNDQGVTLNFSTAVNTYSRLTIGDGLLGQLPSLLLSFATGLIVTNNSSESKLLGEKLKSEFTRSGYVYVITGITLGLMSLIPAFPWFLLIPIGSLFVYFGYRNIKFEKISFEAALRKKQEEKEMAKASSGPEDVNSVAPLDALSLELGLNLIPLAEKSNGAELMERVRRLRREAALDMGLVVPPIHIMDNITLDPGEYSFKIRGIEVGRSRLKVGYYMCMNTGVATKEIHGEATTDPAFGVPAVWISEDQRAEAEAAGYAVVDTPTIIATHLTEVIRTNAADIINREGVSVIIEQIKKDNKIVVDEVLDKYKYSYGEIEKVLQGLLREQISIRNIVTILETLANFGTLTPRDPYFLTEKVREALGMQICLQYVDENKKLSVINVSQSAAEKIYSHRVVPDDGGEPYVGFDPVDGRKWITAVSNAVAAVKQKSLMPILLCAPPVRSLVYQSIHREMPGVVVLSINEVVAAGNKINLEILGEVDV